MRQALGAYGEKLAARHLGERGMVLLDRNWRCAGRRDRPGAARRRRARRLRGQDPRAVAFGTPHEAVTPAQGRRGCTGWSGGGAEHDLPAREVRIDLVAVQRPPRGAALSSTSRGWADAVRDRPHRRRSTAPWAT